MRKLFYPIMWCTCILLLAGCNDTLTKQYRGIYTDDENGMNGLRNPERGLRLEVAINVENWGRDSDADNPQALTRRLENEAQNYQSDSVTLVQTYFYMTETIGRPISEKNFKAMQIFFDKLRELGMKAVLRFAYERDFLGRATSGPTVEDIRVHTAQLKPFLEENKDVIQVLQAGFIGAWGEWHHSFHGLEKSEDTKREILAMICEMTPKDRMIQTRVPRYKNLLAGTDCYNRLSFHDDFIIIKPHIWDADMSEGKPGYEQMKEESPYLIIDGELPWGFWSMNKDPDDPVGGWLIDGLPTARRLFLQHYTSLSAIHNYKERNTTEKFSMIYWKETPITPDFLNENKMPISDGYFRNNAGETVERNVFDYIRDHLGYRIELQQLTIPNKLKTTNNTFHLTLINRGFSTLFNQHPVYIVILNEKNEVVYQHLTDVDVNKWQPHTPSDENCVPLVHTIDADLTLTDSLPKGKYKIGLWIPDGSKKLMYNPQFAIKCANGDVPWVVTPDGKYGINVLAGID